MVLHTHLTHLSTHFFDGYHLNCSKANSWIFKKRPGGDQAGRLCKILGNKRDGKTYMVLRFRCGFLNCCVFYAKHTANGNPHSCKFFVSKNAHVIVNISVYTKWFVERHWPKTCSNHVEKHASKMDGMGLE